MVLGGLFSSSRPRRARSHGNLWSFAGSKPPDQHQQEHQEHQQEDHHQHQQRGNLRPLLGPAPTSAALVPHATASDETADAAVAASATPLALLGDCIYDESQLRPIPEPPPDLRELNHCIEALAVVFPDVQIEVFREMLSHFGRESRLAVVADALLKSKARWVKGRWRLVGGDQPQQQQQQQSGSNTSNKKETEDGPLAVSTPGQVLPSETFRSEPYKAAVRALALSEFKGLSKSTINAILAESNYSYLEARPTLASVSSRSWRVAISSLFTRRRMATSSGSPAEETDPDGDASHPLVVWRQAGRGGQRSVPTIRPTGSPELDRELYESLITPILRRMAKKRLAKDHEVAVQISTQDAEEEGMVFECSCCYGDVPFEQVTACSSDGHIVCFGCVQRSVTEAVFGQGWHSSINRQAATLKCLSVDADDCPGHVPRALLDRAVLEQKNGAEVLGKLDARLADHSLLDSQLPLVRCPFCDYAEVDEVYNPAASGKPRLRISSGAAYNIVFLVLAFAALPYVLPLLVLLVVVCLVSCSERTLGDRLKSEWRAAVARHHRRAVGTKFTCRSPTCGRLSCLTCSKAWVDVHVCNESSLVALRTQVEQAMSMAVKRVCPRCGTSFVKMSGCNKLMCPCGYIMCYVCRADLTTDGYRHFCDHFRPEGGGHPCTECERCNLWEAEDTDRVLREAREEAERKWHEAERRELTGAERAFLTTGIKSADKMTVMLLRRGGKWPTLPEVMDWLVGHLLA